MTPEQAKKLREPFPAEAVGKLPRVTCKPCSENKAQKHCDRHQRVECRVCGNYVTTAHLHLDYVGHAATTDRLLSVDPEWSWEPMAREPNGAPALVRSDNGMGMWINLTVCGVTRPGFGDGKSMKEIIGDAIRNAAMRFGVALDLWAKEDLHSGAVAGSEAGDDRHVDRSGQGAVGAPESSRSPEPPAATGLVPREEAARRDPPSTQSAGVAARMGPHTEPQMRKLRASLGELKRAKPDVDWDAWLARRNDEKYQVSSTANLTFAQMHETINRVVELLDEHKQGAAV